MTVKQETKSNIEPKTKYFFVFLRDLSSNAITSLPNGVFANLTKLQYLWVIRIDSIKVYKCYHYKKAIEKQVSLRIDRIEKYWICLAYL